MLQFALQCVNPSVKAVLMHKKPGDVLGKNEDIRQEETGGYNK
jgi:hypothetical protein